MKIDTRQMLDELNQITQNNLDEALKLKSLSIDQLNLKRNEKSWSALECLEHLNRYGDFYIPEIKQRINGAKHTEKREFKSGWLGNYFANMMLPKDNMKPIKSPKNMDPYGRVLNINVLDEFIKQQQGVLEILELAKSIDLQKTKTSISLSKYIKLRLGDTLRFVVYHNLRHVKQAFRAVK